MKSVYDYFTSQPPIISESCRKWENKINAGWRPNKRIRSMGYADRARFFKVYIWEYLHILYPLLRDLRCV